MIDKRKQPKRCCECGKTSGTVKRTRDARGAVFWLHRRCLLVILGHYTARRT
jgi:hypothetical protein